MARTAVAGGGGQSLTTNIKTITEDISVRPESVSRRFAIVFPKSLSRSYDAAGARTSKIVQTVIPEVPEIQESEELQCFFKKNDTKRF